MMELLMSQAPEDQPAPEALAVAALVQRALEGDSSAFEQIIRRYERRVLTLSLRILGGMDEAQDAAQETFLRAFKYLHRLDAAKPVEPWLIRIAVNVCRDFQRKMRRRRATFSDASPADFEPRCPSPDPYSGFAWEQQRQMLWEAIDNLPEKVRMAVILRDVEGFTTAETARILGSSEVTVRSQICRGRLRVREALDNMWRGSDSV
jgi:RNA polymerase sigma-70 factor (ECF subfamily)